MASQVTALLPYATVALLALLSAASATPTATTLNGTYAGRHLAEFSQDLFLGIPYAEAPRLRNPESLSKPWTDKRPATAYGFACETLASAASLESVNVTMSEDCLNLNIVRPSGTHSRSKLAVVVCLHGGGFTSRFGAERTTNASYVVKASVQNNIPSSP